MTHIDHFVDIKSEIPITICDKCNRLQKLQSSGNFFRCTFCDEIVKLFKENIFLQTMCPSCRTTILVEHRSTHIVRCLLCDKNIQVHCNTSSLNSWKTNHVKRIVVLIQNPPSQSMKRLNMNQHQNKSVKKSYLELDISLGILYHREHQEKENFKNKLNL